MNREDVTKVPPNGKWGWMIVLAYALNGLATISIMQAFSFLFKDVFPRLGFNATEGTIILNTNLAFGMILGLINGPLLRRFGYRKMAVTGSLFYSIGVTMTAFAKSFTFLMIVYGIFASLGSCMTLSAFSYALNSYFTTKRSRAMSLAVTIIGVGPIVAPQITTFFTSYYGFQGTILLYGAFSLHSLVGSLLLQPLKWHTKSANEASVTVKEILSKDEKDNGIVDEREKVGYENNESPKASMQDLNIVQRKRRTTISSINHDTEIGSIYGIDIPYTRQMSETLTRDREFDVYTLVGNGEAGKVDAKSRKRRFKSIDTINLGSSFTIFEEKLPKICSNSANGFEENNFDPQSTVEKASLLQENGITSNGTFGKNEKSENGSNKIGGLKIIVELFDLDLLRDPIYVNIMLGMSIAIFAEINFSQLTPFILVDMKLSTNQIASVMSTIASVDLIFRCLAPFIGEWLHQSPRMMYLLSLCLLIIARTALLFANGFVSMIATAIGLGFAKGIRSVYMSLVVPSYVPIHRLPNASGIQMIANGIILLSAGPMLGVIRDNIGSYTPCIIIMNSVTAVTVIVWTIEMLIVRRKRDTMIKRPVG